MPQQEPYMVTSIGLMVPLARPRAHDIALRDIAHHLATLNRFCGAASLPLSIAQHSLHVAKLLEGLNPRVALLGLLHDAHEAYLGDAITPVKEAMSHALFAGMPSRRDELEAGFDAAIHERFGLAPPDATEKRNIALMDEVAFVTEWRDLMPEGVPCPAAAPPARWRVRPLAWPKAEEAFLAMFDKLSIAAGVHAGATPWLG